MSLNLDIETTSIDKAKAYENGPELAGALLGLIKALDNTMEAKTLDLPEFEAALTEALDWLSIVSFDE